MDQVYSSQLIKYNPQNPYNTLITMHRLTEDTDKDQIENQFITHKLKKHAKRPSVHKHMTPCEKRKMHMKHTKHDKDKKHKVYTPATLEKKVTKSMKKIAKTIRPDLKHTPHEVFNTLIKTYGPDAILHKKIKRIYKHLPDSWIEKKIVKVSHKTKWTLAQIYEKYKQVSGEMSL